jgi:hypothetical protein
MVEIFPARRQAGAATPSIPTAVTGATPGAGPAIKSAAAESRQRFSLDGRWDFYYERDGAMTPAGLAESAVAWQPIDVPGPWQAQFDDLRDASGAGWYRLPVEAPLTWDRASLENYALILHFGAADYHTRLWVNGAFAGEHLGGYLPFEFEIGAYLQAGPNELLARVADSSADAGRYPDYPFPEIPHGKQSWYGPLSGIWQSVYLERRPVLHLQQIRVTPNGERVVVEVTTSHPAPDDALFTYEIYTPEGELCARLESNVTAASLAVETPRLWEPDAPHLYTARVTLQANGQVDALGDSFGFRTIATRGGQIHLNGRPLYLRGALDQDYYPDLIATPPSYEYVEAQLRQAKEMGLNLLRVHIKVADPRYYQAADRLGMLIWTELPSWERLSDAAVERGKAHLAELIARDWNHPSIIIWTIINEAWGAELDTNPDHRAWLAEMYEWVKWLDPTRLVVDNSPCFPNAHVRTDLEDFHFYAAMPDQTARWDEWVERFANRGPWLYGPEYRAGRPAGPDAPPLLCSEFGNWGLPDVGPLFEHYRGEPWWFETGWDWATGEVYPHGAAERFRALHLARQFGDYAGLARSSQWAQYEALKYQIETMRRYNQIAGYVITEFTDCHWECNGLLDMLRRPKAHYQALGSLNADTLVIPRLARRALRSGENVQLELHLSHYGREALANATLEWQLAPKDGGGPAAARLGGRVLGLDAEPATVRSLPPLLFAVPEVTRPEAARLELLLRDESGAIAGRNHLDLALFPAGQPTGRMIACLDNDLATQLEAAGYRVAVPALGEVPLVVTALDEAVRRWLQQGGRVLFLAETPAALQTALPRLELKQRKGTPWWGDWASSFAWLRQELIGGAIPGDGRFDFTFANVVPETVIASTRVRDFEADVLAGIFVGWLRRPAGLSQRYHVGKGELIVTTLKLKDNLAVDPLAATLFDDHLRLLCG